MLRVRVSPPDVHDQIAESEEMQRLVRGDALDRAIYGPTLLTLIIRSAQALGATAIEIDADAAGEVHDQMAAANELVLQRELLQLRRDLPIDEIVVADPVQFDVREFVPGTDEDSWLTVNNRAFAWHPEQSNWTIDVLQQKESEAWFDPTGFLLHERDSRLAGFCWTKIHHGARPKLGEIFVIGVDPDFQGLGLGRALVRAGLTWLGKQGLTNAVLYVESDNATAISLYEDLGFERNEVHRWWRRDFTEGETQLNDVSTGTTEADSR